MKIKRIIMCLILTSFLLIFSYFFYYEYIYSTSIYDFLPLINISNENIELNSLYVSYLDPLNDHNDHENFESSDEDELKVVFDEIKFLKLKRDKKFEFKYQLFGRAEGTFDENISNQQITFTLSDRNSNKYLFIYMSFGREISIMEYDETSDIWHHYRFKIIGDYYEYLIE